MLIAARGEPKLHEGRGKTSCQRLLVAPLTESRKSAGGKKTRLRAWTKRRFVKSVSIRELDTVLEGCKKRDFRCVEG